MLKKLAILFLIVFNFIPSNVNGHGRLMDPPARSTCWREFGSTNCATEYTDNQLSCGGFTTQWNQNGGKCGICGDDFALPTPRKWERGGSSYTGFIVRSYNSGQNIKARVEITANHKGWFEFRLCNADDLYAQGSDATQDCLDKNVLKDLNGNTRFNIDPTYVGFLDYTLVLPAGLTCNRCVFQWKYNTGNSWGTDPITGQQGIGLGAQEQFYGCSDVRILASGLPQTTTLRLLTNQTRPTTIRTVTNQTQTTIRQTTNLSNRCPNGDGFYVDKDMNCRVFYTCLYTGTSEFMINEFFCPNNLRFDLRRNACNFADRVIC